MYSFWGRMKDGRPGGSEVPTEGVWGGCTMPSVDAARNCTCKSVHFGAFGRRLSIFGGRGGEAGNTKKILLSQYFSLGGVIALLPPESMPLFAMYTIYSGCRKTEANYYIIPAFCVTHITFMP